VCAKVEKEKREKEKKKNVAPQTSACMQQQQ
jgi:hypothetical protein